MDGNDVENIKQMPGCRSHGKPRRNSKRGARLVERMVADQPEPQACLHPKHHRFEPLGPDFALC